MNAKFPICRSPRNVLAAVSFTAVLFIGPLHAQTDYFWNGGNNSASPAAGGTGNWNDSNNWRTTSDTGSQATWADGNNAIFAGTAGTVTLAAGDVSANSITINTTGYTFATSGGSRTISGAWNFSTNTVNFSNSNTLTLNDNVSGSAGAKMVFSSSNRINLTGIISVDVEGSSNSPQFVATSSSAVLSGTIESKSTGSSNFQLGANSRQTLTIDGALTGSGNFRFGVDSGGGAGTVILNSSSSSYSGATTINTASSGIVQMGVDNALPTTTSLTVTQGTLALNGRNLTVGSLTGDGGAIRNAAVTASTLTVNQSTNTEFSGAIGSGGTNLALTKSGAGTLALSGANTFTGTTTIQGGTLTLAGTNALGGTSGVTVQSGGTLLLNVSDTVNNSAGVTLAGGTLSRGSGVSEGSASAVGFGTLTLSATSTIDFGTGTGGFLTFSNFSPGAHTLDILNWTYGTDRLVFNADVSSSLASFNFIGGGPFVTQMDLGGGFYEIVAIPEASTALAFASLSLLFLARRRRKAPTVP